MLAIVLILILSVAISFVTSMDSSPVTLHFRETVLADIPLFYVVFAAMVVGALLASVTTIVNLITSKLTIMGKNSDLNKSYKSSDKLVEKVNKLEQEKIELKQEIKEMQSVR